MADGEKYEIISLTFFKDWHELAKKYKLTKEQYGAVVYAMCEYSFYDIESELDPPAGMMFEMSKPYIKSSNKKRLKDITEVHRVKAVRRKETTMPVKKKSR